VGLIFYQRIELRRFASAQCRRPDFAAVGQFCPLGNGLRNSAVARRHIPARLRGQPPGCGRGDGRGRTRGGPRTRHHGRADPVYWASVSPAARWSGRSDVAHALAARAGKPPEAGGEKGECKNYGSMLFKQYPCRGIHGARAGAPQTPRVNGARAWSAGPMPMWVMHSVTASRPPLRLRRIRLPGPASDGDACV
jgi:hypothetical protein